MADGTVVQVIGTVVDVEFPPDSLPALFSGVTITMGSGTQVVTEVQQHLGNNRARCLAMDSTDGMKRGDNAADLGQPIAVPVGEVALGRLFNVLGEPLDGLGDMPAGGVRSPIHRNPPSFEEQAAETTILETGIKVIDLICPFTPWREDRRLRRRRRRQDGRHPGADPQHRHRARRLFRLRRCGRTLARGQRPLARDA